MFGILIGLVAAILVVFMLRDDLRSNVFNAFFALIFGAVIAMFVIPLTGGIVPDYSIGTRDGFITKLSYKGVVFKTWDGEMQVGTGNMSALQEPFAFSVPDENIRDHMYEAADEGYRVRLTYTQYLLPDYRIGEHSYIITDIEFLDQ